VLEPGQRAPADAGVWLGENPITTGELAARGPYLLLFYLYDWTGT
jgi:hypothetical protein